MPVPGPSRRRTRAPKAPATAQPFQRWGEVPRPVPLPLLPKRSSGRGPCAPRPTEPPQPPMAPMLRCGRTKSARSIPCPACLPHWAARLAEGDAHAVGEGPRQKVRRAREGVAHEHRVDLERRESGIFGRPDTGEDRGQPVTAGQAGEMVAVHGIEGDIDSGEARLHQLVDTVIEIRRSRAVRPNRSSNPASSGYPRAGGRREAGCGSLADGRPYRTTP